MNSRILLLICAGLMLFNTGCKENKPGRPDGAQPDKVTSEVDYYITELEETRAKLKKKIATLLKHIVKNLKTKYGEDLSDVVTGDDGSTDLELYEEKTTGPLAAKPSAPSAPASAATTPPASTAATPPAPTSTASTPPAAGAATPPATIAENPPAPTPAPVATTVPAPIPTVVPPPVVVVPAAPVQPAAPATPPTAPAAPIAQPVPPAVATAAAGIQQSIEGLDAPDVDVISWTVTRKPSRNRKARGRVIRRFDNGAE